MTQYYDEIMYHIRRLKRVWARWDAYERSWQIIWWTIVGSAIIGFLIAEIGTTL